MVSRLTIDEFITSLEQRDDPVVLAVCADALLAAGDPHGQVMTAHLQGVRDEAAEGEVEAVLRHVLNDPPGKVRSSRYQWRAGFIDTWRQPSYVPLPKTLATLELLFELLRTPLELVPAMQWTRSCTTAERIRSRRALGRMGTLHVAPWDGRTNYDPLWDFFAREGLPSSIRHFIADDVAEPNHDEHQLTWVELGQLGPVWPAFRQLESLHLRGSYVSLGDIDAPALEHFTLVTSTLSSVAELRSARWPKLKTLSVCFGDDRYNPTPCTEADVATLIREVPPTVTHLGLRNLPFTEALLEVLARSAVLPRLEVLDLSLGVLLDGQEPLLRLASKFSHLLWLDVTDTGLPDFEAVKQVIPGLTRGPEWRTKVQRYVSLME